MKIVGSRDRGSKPGPAEYFTGSVWLDEISVGVEPSRVRLARVSFQPGARTAWHTHPLGQVLHVLTGSGLAQTEGGPVMEIHPGDTISFAPNERHWHGAGPENTMVHLAMQEADDKGSVVTWLEHVTDAEYAAK